MPNGSAPFRPIPFRPMPSPNPNPAPNPNPNPNANPLTLAHWANWDWAKWEDTCPTVVHAELNLTVRHKSHGHITIVTFNLI